MGRKIDDSEEGRRRETGAGELLCNVDQRTRSSERDNIPSWDGDGRSAATRHTKAAQWPPAPDLSWPLLSDLSQLHDKRCVAEASESAIDEFAINLHKRRRKHGQRRVCLLLLFSLHQRYEPPAAHSSANLPSCQIVYYHRAGNTLCDPRATIPG